MKSQAQSKNRTQAPSNRTTAMFMAMIILFFILAIVATITIMAIPRLAQNQFGPADNLDNYDQFRLSLLLLRDRNSLLNSPANAVFENILFVEDGEGPTEIANRLQDNQLISNAEAFVNYLAYKGLDKTLQQGEHRVSSAMTPIEIAYELQEAEPGPIIISILSGWRLEEIGNSLESYGIGLSRDRFIELAKNPAANQINSALPLPGSAEGYLAPATYQFDRATISEEAVLTALLMQFQESLEQDWLAAYQAKGLSLHEAVTIASIIEKESIDPQEMPLIASVIFNRLNINQALEMDTTTQYALGYDAGSDTWWKNPLTNDDLLVASPYNTYSQNGLPPGPICSPSLAALEAVA